MNRSISVRNSRNEAENSWYFSNYPFKLPHQCIPAFVRPTSSDTANMTIEELPFWLVNVPKGKWPAECPDYLANASDKDKRILGTKDVDFQRHTWQEVMDIISENRKSIL